MDEKIKQFIDKRTKLPTDRLPKIIYQYNKIMSKEELFKIPTKGTQRTSRSIVTFRDLSTKKEYYKIEEVQSLYDKAIIDNSSFIMYDVITYYKEVDCVAIDSFTFELNRKVLTEDVNWELRQTGIIKRNKEMIYKNYCVDKPDWIRCQYSLCYRPLLGSVPLDSKLEFHKMFPAMSTGGNDYYFLRDDWSFVNFLNYTEPTKRTGPKQNRIDELIKYSLPEVTLEDLKKEYTKHKKPIESTRKYYNYEYTFAKVDKVDDGICVIRYFYIDKTWELMSESFRIYVDHNKIYSCRLNANYEWVSINTALKTHHFYADYILPIKKRDVKNTQLQYYTEIVKELEYEKRTYMLYAFLTYPNTEKIYKSEYKQLLLNVLSVSSYSLKEAFDIKYGVDIKKKYKNINTLFGLNKYQLAECVKVMEKNTDYSEIIRDIKFAFNTDNIASYTNEIFDKVLSALIDSDGQWYFRCYLSEVLNKVTKLYSVKSMLNVIDKYKVFLKRDWRYDPLNYYRDYLEMVEKLEDTRHFRPNFNNKEDIREMHDAAMAVYNLKKESFRTEAFQKNIKKIEKYKFNDENFTVVIPKLPGELANEGMELHHCVKSYIDRVCDGRTNIAFIRRNEELNKPFFTVEISNSGSIEQVHGFSNRNANTEPGLEKFVKKWAKEKDLKLTGYNKVR